VAQSQWSGNEKCEACLLSPESVVLSNLGYLGERTRYVDSLHPAQVHRKSHLLAPSLHRDGARTGRYRSPDGGGLHDGLVLLFGYHRPG
jgi:hypothetical protein